MEAALRRLGPSEASWPASSRIWSQSYSPRAPASAYLMHARVRWFKGHRTGRERPWGKGLGTDELGLLGYGPGQETLERMPPAGEGPGLPGSRCGRIRDLEPACAQNKNPGSFPSGWLCVVSLGLSPPRGRAQGPGLWTRRLPRWGGGGGRSSSFPPLHFPPLPSISLPTPRRAAPRTPRSKTLHSSPSGGAVRAARPPPRRRTQRQEVNRAPEEVRPRTGRAEMAGPPSRLAPEPGRLWVLQVPLSFSPPHVVAAEDCRGFSGTQA